MGDRSATSRYACGPGDVVAGWHAGAMVALRCELFPADVDAAVRFYVEVLGFDVERDQRGAETPYVALARGGVRVGLAQRAGVGDIAQRRPPVGVELVLEVEDLDAAHRRVLASGWPVDEELTDRPWGLVDFRVLDPVGYYWRITTSAGEQG